MNKQLLDLCIHLKNRCARAKPGLQTASCRASVASLIPITARPQFDRHGAAEAHLFFYDKVSFCDWEPRIRFFFIYTTAFFI